MSTDNLDKLIKDHKIEFIDLRFTDMRGVQHHVTFPQSIVEPGLFEDGKMFDGSSISGWKGIHNSDMVLLPDASTAFVDPVADRRARSRAFLRFPARPAAQPARGRRREFQFRAAHGQGLARAAPAEPIRTLMVRTSKNEPCWCG